MYQDTRTIPMEYVEQKTAVSLEEGQAVFVAQNSQQVKKGAYLEEGRAVFAVQNC